MASSIPRGFRSSLSKLWAIDLHRLHRLSFWDALVIHMARRAGCRIILSEVMQTGRTVEGINIVNPFV